MKKMTLIALALIATIALFAQGFSINTPEGSISMSITGVDAAGNSKSGNIIDNIVVRLERLEKEFHTKLNKVDQKRAASIVEEIYGLLALLPEDARVTLTTSSSSTTTTTSSSTQPNININISGSMVEETPVVQEQPKKQPPKKQQQLVQDISTSNRKAISDRDFNDLISRIGKESFSDDKIRVLRTAARNYKFNVNQIVRIIGAYTYSEDKLQALQISYPECIDPQNGFRIIDAFTFSSDKEEADNIINSY